MNEIGLYIFTVGAAFSFLCFIMKSGGDGKTVRSALGIILIAALITPVAGLIRGGLSLDFDFGTSPPTADDERYSEYMAEAMREGIELALMDKFSLKEGEVSVKILGFDTQRMRCEKCVVKLSYGGGFADFRGIERYCTECGADKCEVIII